MKRRMAGCGEFVNVIFENTPVPSAASDLTDVDRKLPE